MTASPTAATTARAPRGEERDEEVLPGWSVFVRVMESRGGLRSVAVTATGSPSSRCYCAIEPTRREEVSST